MIRKCVVNDKNLAMIWIAYPDIVNFICGNTFGIDRSIRSTQQDKRSRNIWIRRDAWNGGKADRWGYRTGGLRNDR